MLRTNIFKSNAKYKTGTLVYREHLKWVQLSSYRAANGHKKPQHGFALTLVCFAQTRPLWGSSSKSIWIHVPLPFLKGFKAQLWKKPMQAQNLTFCTFPFCHFSDLSGLASLVEKKTITGLKTAWGTDLNVISKATYAVSSTFQEKKNLSPGIHF